ncbi:hypothetical protein A9Q99_02640 [Gammaproteobacteria bacterium 45_16_T64]|nr:hypothetical protein A9Q99_02640 [Gammaproteobacteria bacterium 45_16_T64]
MMTYFLNFLLDGNARRKLAMLFLMFSVSHSSIGSVISPTPQQVAAFKSMPVSEQKRLAKQLGVSWNAGIESATSRPVEIRDTIEPREIYDETANKPSMGVSSNINRLPALGGEGGVEEKDALDREGGSDNFKKEPLKRYGYDLFAGTPTTFAPATDIPVSSDYVVGPGDTVVVQLYGKDNATHELSVNREGVIAFPQLGPMNVSGMMFSELKAHVKNSVSQQMIGVRATVTMGALRSIRVFVLGEAFRPGSYTISALSTITNALLSSGGINKVGSLRNIQLKRKGKLVGKFDLYDLLLKGDTSKDQRLQPGDVIFIPPIGQTVGIGGEVKRPAIYELNARADQVTKSTVEDLVKLAGGLLPTAYLKASSINRINEQGIRTIVDVDLTQFSGKSRTVRDADVIHVSSVLDTLENVIVLKGHVKRPGTFAWKKGARVSDLLPSMHSLLPNADLTYALIRREKQPNHEIEILKVSVGAVINAPGSVADILLDPQDLLWVFDVGIQRIDILENINNQIEFQARSDRYASTATISGNVNLPGKYPIHMGMTVGGLLQAARSFMPGTDLDKAIFVHHLPVTGKINVELISLTGDSLAKMVSAKDELIVFSIEQSRAELMEPVIAQLQFQADKEDELKVVNVSGYVRSPGTYPLSAGMTVGDLIGLAGGFKEQAFGLGAEITRLDTDDKQYQVFQRLTLDLTAQQNGMSTILGSRDQLYIKRIPNWNEKETVSIKGEVNFPGVYPIYKGDTVSDLVSRAGGLTDYAEPYAAVFLRDSLKKREQEQLQRFKKQLERDVAELKLEAAQDITGPKESAAVGGTLLSQLSDAEAMGRLVIDLPRILAESNNTLRAFNIELKNKDQLIIPPKNPEVSVLGEIQFPTSHLYNRSSDVFDYIEISGGYSSRADESRIYIIRANGQVAAVDNGWFIKNNTEVGPGDTVIVPYDVYSVSPMVYWSGVSQILFQLATTVAALNTVGVF